MNANNSSIDRGTFAVGVLGITACVLFVGLMLLMSWSQPAYASGQGDRGGDYVITTQQLSTSQEGLVVIDAASQRLIMYGFDYNQRRLVIVDGFDLSKLRNKDKKQP